MAEQGRSSEVDMMTEAANAQFRAADLMGASVVRAVAPAKVNLFLGVGECKSDGLHAVVNVMHALALHDTVYVNVTPLEDEDASVAHEAIEGGSSRYAFMGDSKRSLVQIDMVDKIGSIFQQSAFPQVHASSNLAFKAVDLFARALGREEEERILIRIEKHVPAQAGLGGGSSDAAAVLACVAHFWNVDDRAMLTEVAAQLGSDVPFFLQGGCGLYEGAGEKRVRALTAEKGPLCLMKPLAGVPTAAAYDAFDADPAFPTEGQLRQVREAKSAGAVPLFNSLNAAAAFVCPELADMREWAINEVGISTDALHLSGSGSAMFVETASFAEATALASRTLKAGFWARATSFSALRAQVF